jgi:hypothetical protein
MGTVNEAHGASAMLTSQHRVQPLHRGAFFYVTKFLLNVSGGKRQLRHKNPHWLIW